MRLFLSLPVPSTIAHAPTLALLRDRFPEGRWVDPAQWHLTVKFLGETPLERVGAVVDSARAVARRIAPFGIALGSFGFFPENAEVLWAAVKIGEEPLARLARELESALASLGFPAEKRRFRPHVTLARFKRPLDRCPPDLPHVWVGDFKAEVLDLMESRLDRNGPAYRCVEKMNLGGPKPNVEGRL